VPPSALHRSLAPADVPPSSPPTRAAWVDQLLRRAILSGELQPGEKLLGEKLAEQWGVSPTPLRESFQRLAGEGLVVIEPQRGARVAPIDAAAAVEVYELRLLLDPAALRSSMEAGADDAAYTANVDEAYRRLVARHRSVMSFHDAHRAFHLSLVAACPNSMLLRQVTQLLDHSQRYHVVSMGSHRAGDPGEEHRALAEAVGRGDTSGAVRTLTAHLQATRDAIVVTAGRREATLG
jgi:DNA-binding GntR family transcriptional regulator